MEMLAKLKSIALSNLRRGREVAWTPQWMRLGNQLGLGLWAHRGFVTGADRRVIHHRLNPDLIELFPNLVDRYMIRPENARFTDQRLFPWQQEDNAGPDWELLDEFIKDVMLPRSPVLTPPRSLSNELVVNVRRGDYYSVPEHRAKLGINVPGYVEAATKESIKNNGLPSSIHVVSDDSAWCRAHLSELLSAVGPVTFRESGDAAGDLAVIAHAERLIIPNSTFSAWGGYIGDVLHPGRTVYAPSMFMRDRDGGANHENAAPWHIIDDVPGGWEPVE